MAQTVVAYFSASGVTARKAAEIAEATGAELYEIRPASPYTSADLNWQNKKSRSSVEMDDPASRPALAEDAPDFSGVSTVFLGFPIWWYVEPRIIDTFLDAADLSGVKVVPFATSGSSGISGAEKHLRELYPAIDWQPGALLNSKNAASWAQGVA